MKGIPSRTSALISQAVIEQQDDKNFATGVELPSSRTINVQRVVIVSAGAIHTPTVLLLSGIRPKG